MSPGTEEKGSRFSINIMWGIIFFALGVTELIKRYLIVYGIPVWAICFFGLALSNFLRDSSFRDKIGIGRDKAALSLKAATIINAVSIVILIVTLVLELTS